MLQRLPIALIQVKSDNTSEIFLNQIRQIIYSLYRTKETTKEVYTNIMNLIKKKKSYKNNKFKISAPTWTKSLNRLMDCILYQKFKNIWKKNGEKINDNINPSMKTYGNKVENRITFKVKTGYYLQLLKS